MAILTDGHSTTVVISTFASTGIYCVVSVTPPSKSGGEKNDLTCMENVKYRTSAPKKLVTSGNISLRVNWDPVIYNTIDDVINQLGTVTINFSDGSNIQEIGSVQDWEPDEIVEGTDPEGTLVVAIHNRNAAGAEVGTVYNAA